MPTNRLHELDSVLEKIERELDRAASSQEIRELRSIVRRPGWRTLAEQSLFLAMATALFDHLQAEARMRGALLEASKQISPIAPKSPRPVPSKQKRN